MTLRTRLPLAKNRPPAWFARVSAPSKIRVEVHLLIATESTVGEVLDYLPE